MPPIEFRTLKGNVVIVDKYSHFESGVHLRGTTKNKPDKAYKCDRRIGDY